MLSKSAVHISLKRIWAREFYPSPTRQMTVNGHDKEISLLIYDIFGGEILKTPQDKGWHFYNKVDGDRLDFSNPSMVELTTESPFKDIQSYPEELYQFIDPDDYYSNYMSFIMAYEEILGLKGLKGYNKLKVESSPAIGKKYHHEIAFKAVRPIIVYPINPFSVGYK